MALPIIVGARGSGREAMPIEKSSSPRHVRGVAFVVEAESPISDANGRRLLNAGGTQSRTNGLAEGSQ